MARLRQHLGLGLLWAAMAWITAVILSQRIQTRPWIDSLLWTYSLRAIPLGFLLGILSAPLLCLDTAPWVSLRFPRRKKLAMFLITSMQGGLIGLILGLACTFLVLFIWPNEAQNGRIDAFKWGAFYWVNHTLLLSTASLAGGASGIYLGRALR